MNRWEQATVKKRISTHQLTSPGYRRTQHYRIDRFGSLRAKSRVGAEQPQPRQTQQDKHATVSTPTGTTTTRLENDGYTDPDWDNADDDGRRTIPTPAGTIPTATESTATPTPTGTMQTTTIDRRYRPRLGRYRPRRTRRQHRPRLGRCRRRRRTAHDTDPGWDDTECDGRRRHRPGRRTMSTTGVRQRRR